MSQQPRPRRVGGSRTPTNRPRKIAGGGGLETGLRPSSTTDEPVVEAPEADPPEADAPEAHAPEADEQPTAGRGFLSARSTTIALVAVIVVFALAAGGELLYLARGDSPTISAQRPVVTGELTHRAAVEAAARSTEQILSTTYQDYDKQVEQATTTMTPTFAKEYRETSDGIKDQFIAQKTKLQVKAVAQGVVQASPSQVQALLFLNQYVEKRQDGQPATSFAQYRALVTVVRSDHGWLVSDIETK